MSTAQTAAPNDNELRLASTPIGDLYLQTELSVPGMHCGGCISRIEKALGALENVLTVRVNLAAKRVRVQWLSNSNATPILETLAQLGFDASVANNVEQQKDTQLSQYLRALAIAGFAASNAMLLSVSVWSGADESTRHLFHYLSALITVPAVMYSGRTFFISAWHALKKFSTNMDVPISVGIFLSLALSVYDTIAQNERVYFEAVAMLVFFLLIGRTLEHTMRTKANTALNGLKALEPAGAMRLEPDGSMVFIATSALEPGDHIEVQAGQRIPVDGIVVQGFSELNTDVVDGESMPRAVTEKQQVLAGMENLSASLIIEVTTSAKDSFLESMLQLVRYAQQSKSQFKKIADRAAALYAPFVHSAAFIAFLFWYWKSADAHTAITIAVSVLIITCPCALSLAVPMVQTLTAHRLFQLGVVMRNGMALEKLQTVDTVVLDKTGTLTSGSATLSPNSRYTDESLAIAQRLAAGSEHPYAAAIASFRKPTNANTANSPLQNINSITEIPACGIEAVANNDVYRLGKKSWALNLRPDNKLGDTDNAESLLSKNAKPLAQFEFTSPLRKDTQVAIDKLKQQVNEVSILSGDKPAPVDSIVNTLNIDVAWSECLPQDKLKHIKNYAANGHKVLMVGDGINDLAAMAAARVSMAPARAASSSRALADFIFLKQSLLTVPETIALARKAHKLVKQNFALALLYNVVALPFAFAGFVSPLIAAIAMSTSSILVVANAMRILKTQPLA